MEVSAQRPGWEKFPALPDSLGFAGMFAGVSKDRVFCMGGANFPDKKPWQGGNKIWYDKIFMYTGNEWTERQEKLPQANGYGVSVSYHDKIILVGGNNQNGYTDRVISCQWDGKGIKIEEYPKLPFPLSNMCGALLGDLIILTAGHSNATSDPLNVCLALDLNDLKKGWMILDPIPGPGRLLPVCGVDKDKYYLFSGENTLTNNAGAKYRNILQDAYSLSIHKTSTSIKCTWQKLALMPKGVSAGPSPLPLLPKTGFVFWGGVDGITGLWRDPATHPGISKDVICYNPQTDVWETLKVLPQENARVTGPVIKWNNVWVYISGEIRPGVRTNSNYSIK